VTICVVTYSLHDWTWRRGRQSIRDRGTRPPKVCVGKDIYCIVLPKVEWRYQSRGTRVGHVPLFSTL